ncbi:DNA recombination protein RmuC [Aliiglaciecola sp. 3_MG-2023]|uniref:DNA recombination protein RmuC n=1 Tax=Aliiglaciecola sp. 3_MG-2023 TaxID=3062644 RepID=UPI0026E22CD0|nr:DNA recombination protein RmuC [Aliiglaciecola sp. 3_MG-2023]MDO6693450.1 DNA recombination protein RmuC [Aliiglaciecola sp. 3_MG-2023]
MNVDLDQNTVLLLVATGFLGLLLGTLVTNVINRQKHLSDKKETQEQQDLIRQQLENQILQLHDDITKMQIKIDEAHQQQLLAQRKFGELEQKDLQIEQLSIQLATWQENAQKANDKSNQYYSQLESQGASFAQERIALEDKLDLLTSAEKRLQEQFENLANKIFEQKQQKFTQSSQAGLDALLTPLKEQIEGFKKQVSDQYVKEGQERASLKTEILGLKELNQQITQDAAALTKALKGDNKQQGNWGEVVLERILTESGLREGHEFDTQVSLKNESGKQYQPDVVVHLPNDKDIVIDSKVSLADYERYFNCQDDELSRQQFLVAHTHSLRNHIKGLGKKDYQDLKGIRTLDYVLMFIPIESAFLVAIDHAPELVKLALDNNIMLVSPTNLLVALRTINNIWQYEYQNQNAQKIATQAGKLYDKFHGFVEDMEKISKSVESLQKNVDAATNKLVSGKGNLVRQIEQFRHLGVQTNKRLRQDLIDQAKDDNGDD